MLEKVENIKRPLKKGEIFLVPCILTTSVEKLSSGKRKKILEVNPVIPHLHSDKENGQEEKHYHLDYRFIELINPSDTETYGAHMVKEIHSTHRFGTEYRPTKEYGELIYYPLPVINEARMGII